MEITSNFTGRNRVTLFGHGKHDLLSPLHRIISRSELLLEQVDSLSEAATKLEVIHQEGLKLMVLLHNRFDPMLAKAQSALDPQRVRRQISAPLYRIEHLCEDLAQHTAPGLNADLNQVREAVQELLGLIGAGAAQPGGQVGAASHAVILVVDDNELNRGVLARQLERLGYGVRCAENGVEALRMIHAAPFDLVLLDIMMPEMDGYQVLERLKRSAVFRHIPVIMVSAMDELESVARCIQGGAADFLTKPFSPVLLRARVAACLESKQRHDQDLIYGRQLEDYSLHLEERVQQQVIELLQSQLAIIFALSRLAESRDPDTGRHLERIREYCRVLAQQVGILPRYRDSVDASYVECIYAASPLHDIGKVAVPDHILLKPGQLTEEEFRVMREHTTLGAETLRAVDQEHPGNDFISMGIEIAEGHHERWDGSGYPHGLRGEAIPLSARITAIADVYDALRTVRCYKRGMTHAEAREIIVGLRGVHFDPEVTDCFVACEEAFQEIATRYA